MVYFYLFMVRQTLATECYIYQILIVNMQAAEVCYKSSFIFDVTHLLLLTFLGICRQTLVQIINGFHLPVSAPVEIQLDIKVARSIIVFNSVTIKNTLLRLSK